ncbi:hypothetical protein CU669_19600 [Paramagnetospirillum kuznetsovii]|uniref:Tyr recombinase domain-containing protein n=2 Tax=Paramagnetospirillum kuznetsovii TaxID=2053833 RepID=A0A364NT26_9PROT|nr:hypothetical protein CU669_19600 [Paramagnetospirillum kuznetsovii]
MLRQASRAMAEIGFGLWLSWLNQQGLLSPGMAITEYLDKAHVEDFARALRQDGNSGITVAIRVGELALTMMAMDMAGDWNWLHKIEKRIRRHAVPVRDKLGRLKSVQELFNLGIGMMNKADSIAAERAPSTAPILFRDGFAISLLALRPLRIANFSSIIIGQHLLEEDDGWHLKFTAHETKGKRPIEVPVPFSLEGALHRYLSVYRPVLLGAAKDMGHLWISGHHQVALTESGMQQAIVRRTRFAFGRSVNPHLFRDCAATSLALLDPEYIWLAAILLGHSNMTTTETHYIQAHTREAADIITSGLLGESVPRLPRSSMAQKLAATRYLTERQGRRNF